MARRSKGSSTPARESASEWPQSSSPTVPPTVNFYFMREFLDGRLETPGMVVNFLHKWQAGVFLREVLECADDITPGPLPEIGGQEDDREGSSLCYTVVTERDGNGAPVKVRRFVGKIMGATYEDLMKRAEGYTDIKMPYSMDSQRRAAIGMGHRSPEAYEAGIEASSLSQEVGLTKREMREKRKEEREEKRASAPEKPEKAPRASREGLTTLTSICEGEGVEPGDVRAALRGMKVEKPAEGWAWAGTVPDYVAKAIKAAKEKRK